MPHLPSEENTGEGLTEKVAKNPSSKTESTASDHPLHHNEHGTGVDVSATKSKGPVIPDSMPQAASKEELRTRAEELNK